MKEVEVKVKISNIKDIKSKLSKLGCEFSETLVQKDKIYLHNTTEFSNIKKGDIVLRIRNSNGKFILTLKKQLENELDNLEKEIIINDQEQGNSILELMDFREVVNVSKKRIKCKYQDFEICLDEVDKLGTFIEIEKMSYVEDSLKIQNELFQFLETLGVKKEEQIFKGYDTLIYELENQQISERKGSKYKEISSQGTNFYLASKRCSEKRPTGKNTFEWLMIPENVCLALCIELNIKSIISYEKHIFSEIHNLEKLFHQINGKTQTEIINFTGYTKANFFEEIKKIANAFIFWRYLYENIHEGFNINSSFINKLANATEKLSNKLK